MLRKFALSAGAAATALAVLAVASAPALAENPPVTIQIAGTGQILADGSAVITVTYSCLAGFGTGPTGDLEAALEEPQAIGGQAAVATCDDRYHTITLDERPGPFTPGEAAANVSLTTGADEYANAQAEVRLTH
jgi:hypothetical protein